MNLKHGAPILESIFYNYTHVYRIVEKCSISKTIYKKSTKLFLWLRRYVIINNANVCVRCVLFYYTNKFIVSIVGLCYPTVFSSFFFFIYFYFYFHSLNVNIFAISISIFFFCDENEFF